jgi:hypothetical protein
MMPNVTIFIPEEMMPSDAVLADLTNQCTQLCTDVLKAALENVHVIYVAVRQGRGNPVFAEICYRLDRVRTPSVMDHFMQALDDAIRRNTSLTARIRCFGYTASSIHARN